jgi:hypothetical protein
VVEHQGFDLLWIALFYKILCHLQQIVPADWASGLHRLTNALEFQQFADQILAIFVEWAPENDAPVGQLTEIRVRK